MTEFVHFPDAILRVKASPRPLDDYLRAFGQRLLDAARSIEAYGLAGAHLGEALPVAVVSVSHPAQPRDYRIFYNPAVTASAGVPEPGIEGSVSLPGVEVEIRRPTSIAVAFNDDDGNVETLGLSGFAARVLQHEVDQINGTFFLDHMSRLKRERLLKRHGYRR